MTLVRTSGKNIEIYEEYDLYTKEYVENVGGKSNFTANETLIGDKPKKAEPLCVSNIYVKVRLKEPYNGEFGFDWVDVNPDTKEIEKIQDVDFENVEYFYKEGATVKDLGEIIEKTSDRTTEANNTIEAHYRFNNCSKYVDMPYVLIKPGQAIELCAEIIAIDSSKIGEDYISITDNDFYTITINGGEKTGQVSKKKIADKEKLVFIIKCEKEQTQAETIINFFHTTASTAAVPVGGFVVMENKVLKLKFRVIALVSNENDPNAKAKALFKKFKDSNVKDYLNNNSLNQAGYEVEIENYNEMDNTDVDEYYYSFDKGDWTTKKYYTEDFNKTMKKWEHVKKAEGGYEMEDDGITYKKVLKDYSKIADVITENDQIDDKVFELYQERLKRKTPPKTYEGGVIILAEYESPTSTWAFSRPNPLNHYGLFVYSDGVDSKDTYAHEIGHMLGLPHSFYTEKEKDSYKNARENILGNNESEKNPNKTKNDKYREGIIKSISEVSNSSDVYYGYKYLNALKLDTISALERYNKAKKIEVDNEIKARDIKKAYFVNYKENDKVGSTQTKKEYFKIWNDNIKRIEDYIEDNKKAITDLKNNKSNNYIESKLQKWFYKTDLLKLLEQNHKYYKNIMNQINENSLFFRQDTTKNFMDYYNNDIRFFYTHNQILIMRSDIQNYMNIPCEFCNPPSTKKKKK